MPDSAVRPISQVRLVDTPQAQPAGSSSLRWRRAWRLSSGTAKPRSPAKPQQVTPAGSTTCSAQAATSRFSLASAPLLAHAAVDVQRDRPRLPRDHQARQQRVVGEFVEIVERQSAREVFLHAADARAGIHDHRVAAVVGRFHERAFRASRPWRRPPRPCPCWRASGRSTACRSLPAGRGRSRRVATVRR